MSVHEIAVAAYERALAIIADRAGVKLPSSDTFVELIQRASQLALPQVDLNATKVRLPLRSIMGRLVGQDYPGYYHPVEISITEASTIESSPILPKASQETISQATYSALWQLLIQEQKQLNLTEQSVAIREANLLALLHRFAWAMPAPPAKQNEKAIDDISLYDFARVTAALAVCMSEQPSNLGDDQPLALLVGGDVSGVQDWLYTLSSEGAARNLRGRSFYLQLLSEVIALYILRRLNLPACNLLYAGGGNFYLLAPLSAKSTLQQIQKEVSSKLLAMHEGALYVALGNTTLSANDLRSGKIGERWGSLTAAMATVKAKRFAELDDIALGQAIGTAQSGDGDPLNTCVICHRVIGGDEKPVLLDTGGKKCMLCDSFEKLGLQLRNAEFLAMSDIQIADSSGKRVNTWQGGLAQFGVDVQLCWAKNADHLQEWQQVSSDKVRIYFWRHRHGFPGVSPTDKTIWAFRPLAQCVPWLEWEDRVADFSEFHSQGIQRWAALRMDVDNLGSIFQHGLPNSNLSRVVSLSGMLRLFFEGHVPALAQQINQQFENRALYLMYAGGDDLFVVGGWSHLPDLAALIRSELQKFACDNTHVTISGGISIAQADKYPLYQAAKDAGEAEDMAKDLDGKDGLAFLGQAVKWGNEYEQVLKRVNDLQQWMGNKQTALPRSFLMALRQIDIEWRKWKREEQGKEPRYRHNNKTIYMGPWVWHMVYQMSRAGERSRDSQLKSEINHFVQAILEKEIFTIGLIARWAELRTRFKSDSTDRV